MVVEVPWGIRRPCSILSEKLVDIVFAPQADILLLLVVLYSAAERCCHLGGHARWV